MHIMELLLKGKNITRIAKEPSLVSEKWTEGSSQKKVFFRNDSSIRGGRGFGIPNFFVKFWWPLFFAIKYTFLFLNVAKIQIFIPK